MKKLRLDIDQVHVEQFETIAPEKPEGTVVGQDATTFKTACLGSCPADSCVTGSMRPCGVCP